MAKSPHIPEFCAKVSQEYLDGVGCYNTNIIDLYDSRRHESLWLKLYRDGMLGRNQGQIMKGISSTTRMYLFIYVYTDS